MRWSAETRLGRREPSNQIRAHKKRAPRRAAGGGGGPYAMQDDGSIARAARYKAEAEAALETMHLRQERHRQSLRGAPGVDVGGVFGVAPPRAPAASSKPRHSGLRSLLTQARRVITGRAPPDKRRSVDPQPSAPRRSLRASSHAYSASGTSSNGSGAGAAFSLASPSSDAGATTPAVNSHLTDRSAASSDGFEPPPGLRSGDRTSLGFDGDSAAPPSAVSAERRAAGRGVRLSGPFAPSAFQRDDDGRAAASLAEPADAASRHARRRNDDGLSGGGGLMDDAYEVDEEGEEDEGDDGGGLSSARLRDPSPRGGALGLPSTLGLRAMGASTQRGDDDEQWERDGGSRLAGRHDSEASSARSGRSGGSVHSGGATGRQLRAAAGGGAHDIPGRQDGRSSSVDQPQPLAQPPPTGGLRALMSSSSSDGLRSFSRRKQLPLDALNSSPPTLSPPAAPAAHRPHPLDGVFGPAPPGPPVLPRQQQQQQQQQQGGGRQTPAPPDGGSGAAVAAAAVLGGLAGPPFSLADTVRRRQEQLRAAIPTPSGAGSASSAAVRPDSPHDRRPTAADGRLSASGGRPSLVAGPPHSQLPGVDPHAAVLAQQLSASLDAHEASMARLQEQLIAARREADETLGALATRLGALETQLAPAWRASADAWLAEYEAGLRAREEELARARARELRGDVAREVKRRAHHFESSLRTLEEKLRGLEAQSFGELASQAGATTLAFGWNGLVTVLAALAFVLGPAFRLLGALVRVVTGLANPHSATSRCGRATGAWCRNVASALCSCGTALHASADSGEGGEAGGGASPTYAGGGKRAARMRSGSLEDLYEQQPPVGGEHAYSGEGPVDEQQWGARAAASRRRSGKQPPGHHPPDEPDGGGGSSRHVGVGASLRPRPQLAVAGDWRQQLAVAASNGGIASASREGGAGDGAAVATTGRAHYPASATTSGDGGADGPTAAAPAPLFLLGGGGGLSSMGSAATAASFTGVLLPPPGVEGGAEDAVAGGGGGGGGVDAASSASMTHHHREEEVGWGPAAASAPGGSSPGGRRGGGGGSVGAGEAAAAAATAGLAPWRLQPAPRGTSSGSPAAAADAPSESSRAAPQRPASAASGAAARGDLQAQLQRELRRVVRRG